MKFITELTEIQTQGNNSVDFVVQNKSDEQVNTIFLSLETAKEKIPDFIDMLLRYRLEMTSYFNVISGIKFLSLLDSWNSEKKPASFIFSIFHWFYLLVCCSSKTNDKRLLITSDRNLCSQVSFLVKGNRRMIKLCEPPRSND